MLSDKGRRDNALTGKPSTCSLTPGCLLRQQLKMQGASKASILGRKGPSIGVEQTKGIKSERADELETCAASWQAVSRRQKRA